LIGPFATWFAGRVASASPTRNQRCANGAVNPTPVYDAYGAIASGSVAHPFGFGGQFGYYTDAATQNTLCGVRWYDPANERWFDHAAAG